MTQACPLPRTIETKVVAPPPLTDSAIALAGCFAVEVSTWLHEHERNGITHGAHTWPAGLMRDVERAIADVMTRRTGETLIAATTAIVPAPNRDGANAVVLLHFKPKGGA